MAPFNKSLPVFTAFDDTAQNGFGKFQQLFPYDENHRCGGQPTCRKLSSCDVNNTKAREQIKPNTTTVQWVSPHVTSIFQNGGETSNLQSPSYFTYNQQTPPSSSVQSFLSQVTPEVQTISGLSTRRVISPEAITTFESTAAVTPSSPNTSDPQPPPKLSTTNLFQCSCTDGKACNSLTDRNDVYKSCNQSDGVYSIKPKDWQGSAFDVFCNMSDSGGWTEVNDMYLKYDTNNLNSSRIHGQNTWTCVACVGRDHQLIRHVIQRRGEGELNVFEKDWEAFKGTFGDMRPGKEFWLGNEIYHLTNQKTYILRIDFQCEDNSTHFAEYSSFRIGDETDKYRVRGLGVYNGTAGQPLVTLKNGACPFTTSDTFSSSYESSCGPPWRYGWWFCSGICIESNLNDWDWGGKEIYWEGLGDIKHTEMKIRPTN